MAFDRSHHVHTIRQAEDPWDVLIVGGGATGLGCAVDAASRGYRTVLLERHDFAKGTSSRSTKLVHGGVRYLRQGNIGLVLNALRERARLMRNAPHLVWRAPFVIPLYHWWDRPLYGVGLKLYDLLAGRSGLGPSRRLTADQTLDHLPGLAPTGLRGGVLYFDAQFDDARLAVSMARTAADHGAAVLNYMEVVGLISDGGQVTGAKARDAETGEEVTIRANVVVNATGVWADRLRRMDESVAEPMVTPSQGAHIVLDRSFLGGDHALVIPRTDDRRVLFAIPWNGVLIVGTTDVGVRDAPLEPVPMEEEIDFLVSHAARYLARGPRREDVLSVFAGLRPLVSDPSAGRTASLARDHTLQVAPSGLVTITGGKWTTYRQMAEETIDRAAEVAALTRRPCVTTELRIRGAHDDPRSLGALAMYGTDASAVQRLIESEPDYQVKLDAHHPFVMGQVVWAVRHEYARTVEDVLARRLRLLVLDAKAAIRAAPDVAATMAKELGRDDRWRRRQIDDLTELAAGSLLSDTERSQRSDITRAHQPRTS